ncbi:MULTISPECIES: copper homeostasis periplasmic binding protein CopC [Rahnella]|uniref:copper homeostasis periplasmic binding protein CopC n=1 Tax=Rahnella sp. 2050 TaxID=3156425 RepID=UPI00129701FD|nr:MULTISPECIES: copper homeostasis periplasmic binding protein CopC [Rahnella]
MAVSAVLLSGFISQQASAHAHLKTETPAADSVLTVSPTELSLGFSEGIEPDFSKITLTDASQKTVKTGKMTLAANDNTQAVLPLSDALSAGKYIVSWNVVSVDGHKTHGQYSFTVK